MGIQEYQPLQTALIKESCDINIHFLYFTIASLAILLTVLVLKYLKRVFRHPMGNMSDGHVAEAIRKDKAVVMAAKDSNTTKQIIQYLRDNYRSFGTYYWLVPVIAIIIIPLSYGILTKIEEVTRNIMIYAILVYHEGIIGLREFEPSGQPDVFSITDYASYGIMSLITAAYFSAKFIYLNTDYELITAA